MLWTVSGVLKIWPRIVFRIKALTKVRALLQEKENALQALSGEHTESLVKIEENEREMEKVRTELDNVTRNFVKISVNQRELKKDLLFYKNVLKTRDQKIKHLAEDRKGMLLLLEELKDETQGKDGMGSDNAFVQTDFPDEVKERLCGKDALVQTNLPRNNAFVQTIFPEELKERLCSKDALVQTNLPRNNDLVQTIFPEELKERLGGKNALVQTNFPEERKERVCGKDALVQTNLPTNDAFVQTNFPEELEERLCSKNALVLTNLPSNHAVVNMDFPSNDAVVQTNFPAEREKKVHSKDALVQTNSLSYHAAVQTNFPEAFHEQREELSRSEEAQDTACCPYCRGGVDKTDVGVEVVCPETERNVAVVQTSFPEQPPEMWAGQCTQLLESIALGDEIMAGQVRSLKLENDRLAAKVESLNKELENRCAAGGLKMTEIIETMDKLASDMNQFLSTVDQKATNTEGILQNHNTEYDMMRDLSGTRKQALALRCANADLEEQLKKQTSWLDAVWQGQEADDRRATSEKPTDLKMGSQKTISMDSSGMMVVRDLHLQVGDLLEKAEESASAKSFEEKQQLTTSNKRLSLESKVVILENANNELVTYVDTLHKLLAQNSAGERERPGGLHLKNSQLVFQPVDMLNIPELNLNVFEELYRISVFLQVCLLKTRTIASAEKTNELYTAIISELEGLLLNVRSAVSCNGSWESSYPLPIAEGEFSDAEPNILVDSKTELETQLCMYQRNNSMLREALAVSEEERRKEEQRHNIQIYDLIQKFKLRLKENRINVSTCNADPAKDGKCCKILFSIFF